MGTNYKSGNDMPAQNDITGDMIQSKNNSNSYRDNWDKIFGDKVIEKVDVALGSDVMKKLNIKCEYFEDAAEIFKEVTGKSFDDIDYVDDLVIYELIVSITCNDYIKEEDMDLLVCMREFALYMLSISNSEQKKFDRFYYQWIKDHKVE